MQVINDASAHLKNRAEQHLTTQIDAVMQEATARVEQEKKRIIEQATKQSTAIITQAQEKSARIRQDAIAQAKKLVENAFSTRQQREFLRVKQHLITELSKSKGTTRQYIEHILCAHVEQAVTEHGLDAKTQPAQIFGTVLVAKATTPVMEIRYGVDDLVEHNHQHILSVVAQELRERE